MKEEQREREIIMGKIIGQRKEERGKSRGKERKER